MGPTRPQSWPGWRQRPSGSAQRGNVLLELLGLLVHPDNQRAIRLYESLGFAHEGRLVGAFVVGGTAYDELVMGLQI